jgi:transposase-like protein
VRRSSRDTGGRKDPHSPEVRAEALRLARRDGAAAAAKALGLPAGTVRSWVRRQELHELRRQPDDDGVLARLKAEGQEILRRHERERREAEREAQEAAEQVDAQPAVEPASESPTGSSK